MKIVREGKEGDESKRLLLYLADITGQNFTNMTIIKNGVFLCQTDKEKWVLKEFSKSSKLNMQVRLTESLLSNNFPHTYKFHPIHAEKQIQFNKKTYGLIEYIENEKGTKFSYRNHENRKQALQLLKKYHNVTGKFTKDYEKTFPLFNQIKKWQERLNEFKANEKYIMKWLPLKYYNAFIYWSEWSIENMLKNKDYFTNKPYCIIHGDVAHHNFILSDKGLYLIDFDLAKIAPALIDDLQFCNRILPQLDWSLDKLFIYRQLEQYKTEKPFLTALVYPTDLLREWNHFLQYEHGRERLSSFLTEITFREFKYREKFVKDVMYQIKHH